MRLIGLLSFFGSRSGRGFITSIIVVLVSKALQEKGSGAVALSFSVEAKEEEE